MIAIIIPYYKKKFFRNTLKSLANQTDKRFKVYIGDDDSPENPTDIISEFKDTLNIVYFKFQINLGSKSLVKHWERCINLIRDENWITILGDDDTYGANVVSEFYNNYNDLFNLDIKVLRYSTIKIDSKDKQISKVNTNERIEKSIDFFFKNTPSSLSEYFFEREQLQKVKFKDFPLAWHSDQLAVIEVSDFGNVLSVENANVYVRISELSISGNQNLYYEKLNASFMFYHYLLKKYLSKFDKQQYDMLSIKLNKCFINNKKRVDWFLKTSYLYLTNKKIKDFFLFYNQIIKNL
ncbi:glycosyltransferase family 2 protein [Psychroflexus sp. YR1-1]|uniref:Glycosyltransferase family 2 protein n=1 Tax=Psychroflexus aurantiacus TaxID=2709310 RepID=A0A6B3R8S8_9FLAO|nr:glycosyltransferase family 2 protein [Psychroflexus aurantiacus]NEV93944.1 glycosyltransferase family 2 protein [Psychroflexus aurantiacus]